MEAECFKYLYTNLTSTVFSLDFRPSCNCQCVGQEFSGFNGLGFRLGIYQINWGNGATFQVAVTCFIYTMFHI